MEGLLVGDRYQERYRIGRQIGNGAFGVIYQGTDTVTKEEVAIKVEDVSISTRRQLRNEAKVYSLLPRDAVGIPRFKWYGPNASGAYDILVMDLLGPSLETKFQRCARKFTLQTVILLAQQMIDRIELLHTLGYIHRDIKPDNFVLGRPEDTATAKQVYMIDLGLAKRYRDPTTGKHIPFVNGKGLIGSKRYASMNAVRGLEQSRRDDLESLCYVLLFWLHGSLPWQGGRGHKKKLSVIEELCADYPSELTDYWTYCRRLSFSEKPNYEYLRTLFRTVAQREGLTETVYDWERPDQILKEEDRFDSSQWTRTPSPRTQLNSGYSLVNNTSRH